MTCERGTLENSHLMQNAKMPYSKQAEKVYGV